MNNEKIKALLTNKEFVSKFQVVEDAKELEQLIKEYAPDMSEEEMAAFVFSATESQKDDELFEEDLEAVSGGIFTALGKILGATCAYAVSVYGSPQKAVEGVTSFWCNKLGIK